MQSEEDQKTTEEERKRPPRLTRSGDLSAAKSTVQEEEVAEPGDGWWAGPPGEEAWDGGGRVPEWLIRGTAVVLPLLGIWLLVSVLAGGSGEDRAVEGVVEAPEPQVGGRNPIGVARAFLEAESTEERLALAWRPDATREHLQNYVREAVDTPVEVSSIERLGVVQVMEDLRYFRFRVASPGRERRLLCVIDTAEGLRVDWDAFARYETAPRGGLYEGPWTEAMVRVFVRESRYYNYSFSDDKRWVSYELRNPDWKEPVYGYARRKSTTGRILSRLVRRAGREGQRMTLKLSGQGGATVHRQYGIEEVLAAGWVLTDKEFEPAWERREELRKRAARGEFAGRASGRSPER